MDSIAISYSKNKRNLPLFPAAINRIEKVRIGGVDQWILIRGHSTNNPILLFLHGGPGAAQISFAPKFQGELEKNFIVVNWDQRGAGKSFTKEVAEDSMNIPQFTCDTLELVRYLLLQFKREKLYLAAHSWGSIFGLKAVQKRPEYFHAYIGIGQAVDMQQTARILHRYNYDAAKKFKNKKAFKQLGGTGNAPKERIPFEALLHIKWLEKFGGIFNKRNLKKDIVRIMLFSKEYSVLDKVRYKSGSLFSFKSLFNELMDVNLFKEIKEIQVPVYFCTGCHDYNTPFMLTEQYFKMLRAPRKKMVWFNHSGHAPHFEEPDKFNTLMISTVLPQTLKTFTGPNQLR